MDFSSWITQRFVEWRGARVGNSASIAEFGKQFGAPQQLVSSWMKPADAGGKIPRSAKYINALAAVYGTEVYLILGLVGWDEELTGLDQLEPGDRDALLSAFEEAGLPVNSEDDLERVIKALVSRGMKVTRIR